MSVEGRAARLRLLLRMPWLRRRAHDFATAVGLAPLDVEIVTGEEFNSALHALVLRGDRLAEEWPISPASDAVWRLYAPAEWEAIARIIATTDLVPDVALLVLDTGVSEIGGFRTSLRELIRNLPHIVPAFGEDLLATTTDATTVLIVHAHDVEDEAGHFEVVALGPWLNDVEWPVGGGPLPAPFESPVYG